MIDSPFASLSPIVNYLFEKHQNPYAFEKPKFSIIMRPPGVNQRYKGALRAMEIKTFRNRLPVKDKHEWTKSVYFICCINNLNSLQIVQKMGPKQSDSYQQKQKQFFSQYDVIQQIPNQNIRFLEHKKSKNQYLLRQLSYNDRKEYLKTLDLIKTKKQQLKGAEHVTNLEEYFQKQEDQYCSTFYKIYVLFQYPQRTLDDEITERNVDKKSFAESELWSILASCILGLSHLQRKGIKHSCLKSSTIFLSPEGHIKISDPFASGCTNNYQTLLNKRNTRHIYMSPQQCQSLQNEQISPNINPFKSDIFTLGMVLLECGLLFYQDDCYRDENSRIHWETLEYKKNIFKRSYSEELANMLEYMLGPDVSSRPEWVELESYVITDSMGKSFISDGRQSIIVVGNSKPGSVNTINPGYQFPARKDPISIIDNQATHQRPTSNRGIGVSSTKPMSVQRPVDSGLKSFDYRSNIEGPSQEKPYSTTHFNQSPLVGSGIKAKSTSNLLPFYSSNVNASTSNYDFHKTQNIHAASSVYGPTQGQVQKRYDIKPLAVSNIGQSRPLKSIFPNPFFEFTTKMDENLVEVGDDDGSTSRSVSETSQYQHQHQQQPQTSNHGYSSSPYQSSYSQNPSSTVININNQGSSSRLKTDSYQPQTQNGGDFSKKKDKGEFVIQTFKLGSRYEGYKKNGLRNGQGKFYYQDGGMYDGSWQNNKMQGYGRLYYQSGKIAYEGDWVADQFTGKGTLYNEKPDQIQGGFDYHNFDDVDELWTKYEGQFSEDLKHGHGVLYISNGQFFEGNFEADAAEGLGVFNDIEGNKIRGIWENNIYVREA